MPSDEYFILVNQDRRCKTDRADEICRICFFVWVRGFLGWGLTWSMGTTV
jgi:hypothetical protein